MNRRDVDAIIAGSNPVDIDAVESLPLGEAERELIAAIAAVPATPPSRGSFGAREAQKEPRDGEGWVQRRLLGRGAHPGRRSLALGGAVATLAAAVLIVGGAGGGTTAGPDAALGDDITELLKASPTILLDAPGWRVYKLDEPFQSQGIVNFYRSSAPLNEPEGAKGFAELQWSAEPLRKRIQALRSRPRVLRELAQRESIELAPYLQRETTAPVLGTTAKVFIHPESSDSPLLEGAAVWMHRGRVFQLRSFTANVADFKRRLASLREVGYRAWRAALPARIEKRGRGIFAADPEQDKGEQ